MKIPIFSRLKAKRETEQLTPKEFAKLFMEYTNSKAGVPVNRETAIKVAAVFACVNLISQTIAALPLGLYKNIQNGKIKAEEHNLYALLHDLPNPQTVSFDFWQMLIVNLLLTGDGIAVIKRDQDGIIRELWNIPSSAVSIYKNSKTNEKYYIITESGVQYKYYPENIMHIQGMKFSSSDSALDPIEIAREALGLSLATEEYGSKYFSQGGNMGGAIEVPVAMSEEAFLRFKESFQTAYSGLGGAHKWLFLEEGAKANKLNSDPEESQFLETRKFQVIEIARFFNVPPHMIMDLERATFSNIEQQSINFVQFCLSPWLKKIEQTIFRDLLSPNDRKKHYAKFGVNALLRGDTAARKDFYNTMVQCGAFSPNIILELEDMNTFEGGDVRMVNGNMIPVNMLEDYYKYKMNSGKGGENDEKTGKAG